jgi:ABC-type nitrate/sulfonate/bicarbonate transport system permease component
MTLALRDNALRLWVFGPLIVAWELAVRLSAQPDRYPLPSGVVAALVRTTVNGVLPTAVTQSLSRVLIAFVLAAAFGILLGLLIGRSRVVDRGLSPIINALRSIAPIAWIPMAVLWLGVTGNAAIFIVAYAAVFPIVLNTAQAVQLLDRRYIDAALTLGAGRFTLLSRVIFRGALPTVVTGARIAMGFAWASIIAAELAMGIKLETGGQVRAGLGQLMVSTLYIDRDINGLVLYMLTIGVIGLIIDRLMRRLHRAVAPWEYR